jgi:transcriptional regulator with XRE-family HTH domain
VAASEEAPPRVAQVALGPDRAERDEILRRFGGNLKARRVAAGLTQSTLSERCFLPSEQVSNLERGQVAPSLLVLLMLCDTLGTSLDELTEGVGAPTRQASCRVVRQLIEESPGISTAEIADSLDLPFSYVFRGIRRMSSLGEIRGPSSNWQPNPRSRQWGVGRLHGMTSAEASQVECRPDGAAEGASCGRGQQRRDRRGAQSSGLAGETGHSTR